MQPIVLIDVDGLRPDVFVKAVRKGHTPHLARMFGGENFANGVIIPAIAPAPSITFNSQASLFTGSHPARHGIPGNQFFDRFGVNSGGKPRLYAFDIGDMLAVDDAIRVFTDGLASKCLQTATLHEMMERRGFRSVVVGHMYGRGAAEWIKPSILSMSRLTKGPGPLRMEAETFDKKILEDALKFLEQEGLPDLLTVYFLGNDHESHARGPDFQENYLANVMDPLVGQLWEGVQKASQEAALIWVIVSDHGQIRVHPEDRFSLRLAFPFERELGPLFDAFGFDVNDIPGEDPDVDSVFAANGGSAFVYLRKRKGSWGEPPDFESGVLPVAKAFWEGHQTGKYAPELEGSLAGVFVRKAEQAGWDSTYYALTSGGDLQTLEDWFQDQPESQYIDPVNRLRNLAGGMSGDILLLSNYEEGFYFGGPMNGVHGGLHPEDSRAVMAFGWPGANEAAWNPAKQRILEAVRERCRMEGGRQPSTADLVPAIWALFE